jgi:hypothetical protein
MIMGKIKNIRNERICFIDVEIEKIIIPPHKNVNKINPLRVDDLRSREKIRILIPIDKIIENLINKKYCKRTKTDIKGTNVGWLIHYSIPYILSHFHSI